MTATSSVISSSRTSCFDIGDPSSWRAASSIASTSSRSSPPGSARRSSISSNSRASLWSRRLTNCASAAPRCRNGIIEAGWAPTSRFFVSSSRTVSSRVPGSSPNTARRITSIVSPWRRVQATG